MDRSASESLDRWLTTPPEEKQQSYRRMAIENGFIAILTKLEDEGRLFTHTDGTGRYWTLTYRQLLKEIFLAGFENGAEFAYDDLGSTEDDEPETTEHDPGPEVDDEGGMSERHFLHPDDYDV